MIGIIIRWEIWVFLIAAAGIVGFQVLTGRINTGGLLRTRLGGPLSPTRAQLLFATLGFAGWYIDQVRIAADGASLPPVPTSVLLALAGSHATYLTAKGVTRLDWLQYFYRN